MDLLAFRASGAAQDITQPLDTQGQIHLNVSWRQVGESTRPKADSAASAAEGAADGADADSSVEVQVLLKKGEGLLAADKNGKSDPFVRLTLGSQKKKSKARRAPALRWHAPSTDDCRHKHTSTEHPRPAHDAAWRTLLRTRPCAGARAVGVATRPALRQRAWSRKRQLGHRQSPPPPHAPKRSPRSPPRTHTAARQRRTRWPHACYSRLGVRVRASVCA